MWTRNAANLPDKIEMQMCMNVARAETEDPSGPAATNADGHLGNLAAYSRQVWTQWHSWPT